MSDRLFAAVEIGGTKLQVVTGAPEQGITERFRFAVDRAAGAEGIRDLLGPALVKLRGRIAAVGIGFGGPVDWRSGVIACSHQIGGWMDFDLKSWATERTGCPAFVDNDANVAALGEALSGAGRGFGSVFYVTLGSGVGGGLVSGGKIFHGAAPGESELGHLRLSKDVIIEERCSGWAVDKMIRERAGEFPESLLTRLVRQHGPPEARYLAGAIEQHDPFAERIIAEVSDDLALGLSHVTHLMHPERIVLGGGLSLVGEPLRCAVEKALARYVMKVFSPGPSVALAALREDAVPLGGLWLAAQSLQEVP